MPGRWLSSPRREQLSLLLYSLKTPMLLLLQPKVVEITTKRVVIRLPLTYISRNSWGTIFFGAIAAAADLTGGFHAFEHGPSKKVGVLYKDCTFQFLRRADGDLHLVCEDGLSVADAIAKADLTGERVNVPVSVAGFCYHHSTSDPVFLSKMTLSLKSLKKKPF